MVKIGDKVITDDKVLDVYFDSGWNNSMATYYPSIRIVRFIDDKLHFEEKSLGEHYNPFELQKTIQFDKCPDQTANYKEHVRKQKEYEDSITVKQGKTIKVVRGKKSYLGMVGTAEWVGPSKFVGDRIMIKLKNGGVLWTDLDNVEVYKGDKEKLN